MKYTEKALQRMANRLMAAKESGDYRYLQFVVTVSLKTGESTETICAGRRFI